MKVLPSIELDDTGDIFSMSEEELSKVFSTKLKWRCCIKHCKHYTNVKDFGILPFVFWRKQWVNLNNQIFYCGKHWKRYKKTLAPEYYRKEGPGINHIVK